MLKTRHAVVIAGVALALLASPALAVTTPNPVAIPSAPGSELAASYIGAPAIQNPLFPPAIPQNSFMSTNPWNSLHNDPYASDTYTTAGPLGRAPKVTSTWLGTPELPTAEIMTMTFDAEGRAVGAATLFDPKAGMSRPRLYLIDPSTLATKATYDLPGESYDPSDSTWVPAGIYLYSDSNDNTVVGTSEQKILVLSHTDTAFNLIRTIDLTSAIPADDHVVTLQPDFRGYTWFATRGGTMGTVDMTKGKVLGTYRMGKNEENVNSMAADEDGGVYVASTKYMYRFDATNKGKPQLTWKAKYDAGTRIKPGQLSRGTGTTPTLMGSKYVTIADNADPRMHVVVFKRAKKVSGSRKLCEVPVFGANAGSTENSLVATDSAIIVENNYGYSGANSTADGKTTTPGLTRIDISSKGKCKTTWTNNDVVIPSVVTKMSVSNGLIYSYTKAAGPGTTDAWYFTALDFRTGQVVYSVLAGYGLLYNNHYAPVYLGPDGAAYVGVLGGLIRIGDTA